MAEDTKTSGTVPEPRGFGEHARGLAGEYAHEQGWGLNEAERTALPRDRQPSYGGTEYDYSARDFGDEPTDMSAAAGGKADDLERDVEKALGGTTQGGDVTEALEKDAGSKGATGKSGSESSKEEE